MSENKDQQNQPLSLDVPYFLKFCQNSFTNNQTKRVKEYFENQKNNFIHQNQYYNNQPNGLKEDENNTTYQYYLGNHRFMLPLKIFIEKLKKGKIDKIQIKVVQILIWSIFMEKQLIWHDHQLYLNNISADNILIVSKKDLYFVNCFKYIDVRFINFDLSIQFANNSSCAKKQKDNQNLIQLIQELYQLINSKQVVTQDNLELLIQGINYNDRLKDDQDQSIYNMSWNQEQIKALNELFKDKKYSFQLTHSVLKAILLQHFYLSPEYTYDQQSFDKLTAKFKNLLQKIDSLQNNYKNEISKFQNQLNFYINQNYQLGHDIIVDTEFVNDFDKNVFNKMVDLADFKQNAIYEIEKIIDSEYEKTLSDTKNSIQNHFQSELEIFIYSLYCDLI
ncbi:unnamed protein product (macronuclear) [Paramecium tetraurelia]|uniref:Uncharacterized protein n=1 Tax=Paramecium tetraurelia TaxID=5888 RepID=A0DFD8_PARTE|nr:uncharacterized protein GSPATT00016568001 [Paramecium tetraurelia]CAK81755.1 unnamed protein product [Paramecium tetraurelia]|eukprot:XP_001449152.1 hypothetical protein (macronuclear) [Paramecium tetraurelia strain d4-2]